MVQEVWLCYKVIIKPMKVKESCDLVFTESREYVQKIEEKANEMLNDGYVLVKIMETTTAKAILIFKI